ncbi:hypothetical protein SAMN05660420_00809 [Desulfuromusa kysingii]|uniref:Uncharacterized protein n=1 Tax=Desulfuromusa kysingii TaxID=37625 RepID=A0A1H3X3H8_9BACT|nr:hypothetical protein SAMN05660420_00809 [Desulfuromusa kysingii]
MRRSRNGTADLRSERQMFEGFSPSFCRSSKQSWNGGNPRYRGQGAGHPFLHTHLWCDKRVWRRAGSQPRDLVHYSILFQCLLDKAFLSLMREEPAGFVPPTERLFYRDIEKYPKEVAPIPAPAKAGSFRSANRRCAHKTRGLQPLKHSSLIPSPVCPAPALV